MTQQARKAIVVLLVVILASATAFAQTENDSPVAVGNKAPSFTITTEEGDFTLSSREGSEDDNGKYRVLVFVRAHW